MSGVVSPAPQGGRHKGPCQPKDNKPMRVSNKTCSTVNRIMRASKHNIWTCIPSLNRPKVNYRQDRCHFTLVLLHCDRFDICIRCLAANFNSVYAPTWGPSDSRLFQPASLGVARSDRRVPSETHQKQTIHCMAARAQPGRLVSIFANVHPCDPNLQADMRRARSGMHGGTDS